MPSFNDVSESALIKRINRKLRSSGSWEQLRTSRSAQLEQNVGRHYMLDIYRNLVTQTGLDVETVARDLGVLHELEHVSATR